MPALITWFRHDVTTLAPAAADTAIQSVSAHLLRCWMSPQRGYHTTRHLLEMFSALDELGKSGALDHRAQALARIAAWCHDAVYVIPDPSLADPSAPSNEQASAAYAAEALQSLTFRADDIAVVERLIRASERHDLPAPTGVDAAFHDADLWILSAPITRFDEYCAQVRAEYSSVPDAAYATGRTAILRPFLTRERLYATEHAHQNWNEAARDNLERELARLAS